MRQRHWNKPKLRNSLLSRYVLIIAIAFLFIPVAVPAGLILSFTVNYYFFPEHQIEQPVRYNSGDLEEMWHKEAKQLGGYKSPEEIDAKLREIKDKYPQASLFWVDSAERTRLQLPKQSDLPARWSTENTIQFMKTVSNTNTFGVVAFIGDKTARGEGFMVLKISREYLKQGREFENRFYGLFLLALLSIFLLLSYLFFRNIRKRLLNLESGMMRTNKDGLPIRVDEGRADEIGSLEKAFNHMVGKLEEGKRREQEEEKLRKNLINNLSHDLRTPLTVLSGHIYALDKQPLPEEAHESVQLMKTKISDLDHLIDHLLSYNLLTSGRYAMSAKAQDILRIVRVSAAAWYPIWEKAELTIDIDLPDEPLIWEVDEQAFRRILDNLFQNLYRYASSGKYVGIATVQRYERTALLIADHGPGFNADTPSKGAGLGLAIVDLLMKQMKLVLEIDTSDTGTRIYIYPANLS
ncbi:histidine kinase dimerization/phospho-acceptor domain-containing protein [Paenibacillus motobuensis]|uniref:HAMP domain-containing sensor histidine kinase n=1 Tax=Paenibacillus motobuensis TaxID=295324 RepID=UPI003641A933